MPAPTIVPFGDAKAAKKWSTQLFLDIAKKGYFDRKFVGTSPNSVIQRLTDLDQNAGDTIHFDLSVQLRQEPVYGDNKLENNEEQLRFYGDDIIIDQIRHGISVGGRMSQKRTAHNLREIGRERLSDYWSKVIDEMQFIYLSGLRGVNEDYTFPTSWAGHANNPIQAPDTKHVVYASTAVSDATLTNAMPMSKAVVEKAAVKAEMLRSVDPTTQSLMPVMINGEAHYVLLMSPFQAYAMRTGDTAGWLDIQKAAAAAEGRDNPIFKGGLGMINNVVLHSHQSVIRASTWGAGSNLAGARALFMGRQAGVIAYGNSGGTRFNWTEEIRDHGNDPRVGAGTIIGVKKTRFNGADFGVIAVDTYAVNPNA